MEEASDLIGKTLYLVNYKKGVLEEKYIEELSRVYWSGRGTTLLITTSGEEIVYTMIHHKYTDYEVAKTKLIKHFKDKLDESQKEYQKVLDRYS